jgi:SAM-dependent methyltransferase
MSTDADWNKWGRTDPYYGVFTNEKYRTTRLTDEALRDFFQSGTDQVDYILRTIRHHLDDSFSPRTVLDFGCGTGRLLIPFAGIAETVLGLDVSDGMLQEAVRNCEKFNVTNVSVSKSDDNLTKLTGTFDLVHSVIVFQHIPPPRGIRLFKNLLRHLSDGGVGAIQITYSDEVAYQSRLSGWVRRVRKLLGRLKRSIIRLLLKGDSEMQMNSYPVNQLLLPMQRAGIRTFFAEFTDHGGHYGVYLFFQKPKMQNQAL